jgi:hypothetical protein
MKILVHREFPFQSIKIHVSDSTKDRPFIPGAIMLTQTPGDPV